MIGPKEKPDRITLELTNYCNLSCTMCPRHYMKYPKGYIVPSLFKKIIDEMVSHDIKVLVPFFRGEALLHPGFLDLMTYAKAQGLTVQLATNGVLMTHDIARSLVEMGIDFLSFSVDSIDETEYRNLRRGSDLKDLLRAIDFMLEEKTNHGSATPVVQVSAVDTGISPEAKDRFVQYFTTRVERVRIYPQHTKEGDFGSLDLEPDIPRQPCLKPFTDMVIYWDGKAALCNHDWDRHELLGDASTQGLMDIWRSETYTRIREAHITCTFTDTDVCKKCGHWAQYYTQDRFIGELYGDI